MRVWEVASDVVNDGGVVISSLDCEEAGGGGDFLFRRLDLAFECQGVDEGPATQLSSCEAAAGVSEGWPSNFGSK
jgi:hypothetical protein